MNCPARQNNIERPQTSICIWTSIKKCSCIT